MHKWFITVVLALAVLFTYNSIDGGELNYDDERYITTNQLIKDLNAESLRTIFSSNFDGHYHPLTLLSLALDRQVFSNPVKGHHITNWLLHLANALLVYLFLFNLFKQQWLAFGVTLLFALHPMNVESYAWMTERKNLLYSFFFLLSGLTYSRYIERPSGGLLWLTFLFFALSILSKAQAMMLVPVLFLLDWTKSRNFTTGRLYLEKLPFFLLATAFVFLTSTAQVERWGDLDTSGYTQFEKLFTASTAFFQYVFKGLFPVQLTAYYPYPKDVQQDLTTWHYLSPLFLLAFLGTLVYAFKKSQMLFFGMSFFFINIVVMLKFLDVPFGNYLMADRYNYLPLVGLMIPVVMLLLYLAKRFKSTAQVRLILILLVAVPFGLMSHERIKVWNNSISLWSDIIDDYPQYKHAYNMRSLGYIAKGKPQEAIEDLHKLMELEPGFVDAYLNLAILHYKLGEHDKALQVVQMARPNFDKEPRFLNLSATVHSKHRDFATALRDINRAIEVEPANSPHKITKAQVLINKGDKAGAEEVLKSIPQDQQARSLLAKLKAPPATPVAASGASSAEQLVSRATSMAKQGQLQQAIGMYNLAIEHDSNYEVAYLNRGSTYGRMGKLTLALRDFQKVAELNPYEAKAYFLMGVVYKDMGKKQEACHNLQRAQQKGWKLSADLVDYCR